MALGALSFKRSACRAAPVPDEWNLSHPEIVDQVPRRYVEAGSQVVLTNTFRANRIALASYNLADNVVDINRRGVEISRSAVGDRAHVFASMGPTGKMLMAGEVSEEELRAAFAEQASRAGRRGCRGAGHRDDGGTGGSRTGLGGRQADRAAGRRLCGVRFRRESRPHDDGCDARRGGGAAHGSRSGCGRRELRTGHRRLRGHLPAHADRHRPAAVDQGQRGHSGRRRRARRVSDLAGAVRLARALPCWRPAQFVGGCCGTSPAYIAALCKEIRQ